jgi:acyl carrier protein
MNNADIYHQLTPLFLEIFDAPDLKLRPDMTAQDVAGWDSLNNIRLIMSIQRRFSVRFSAAEIGRLKNVGELVALIYTKTAGRAMPATAAP